MDLSLFGDNNFDQVEFMALNCLMLKQY